MKIAFLSAIVSIGMMVGCSHFEANKRAISSVDDVGIVGPDGEVLLYYKEGNFIIIKKCENNTVLGSSPILARANCVGKSNKVPLEVFKQALKGLVSTDRLNILKPLTPDEVAAYSKVGPSASEIEAMVVELDKINAFITSYGGENANLVRKEELIRSLRSTELRISAIKKINIEVEKAIELIVNDSVLTIKKFSNDKDQFLYTVLKNFDPTIKFPCGLTGRVEDRIADCSIQDSSIRGNFVLVSRSNEFREVYKDTKTGLLWSDRLDTSMDHYDAQNACKNGIKAVVGIQASWRLPSIIDYSDAKKNGIRRELPNRSHWWSSTISTDNPGVAWEFSGIDNDKDVVVGRSYDLAVRCVAF